MASFVIKVHLVWCVLLGLLVVSMAAARLARAPLSMEAQLPERSTCGARIAVPVRLAHRGTRPALDVHVTFQALPSALESEPEDGVYLARIEPGEERVVHLALEFRQRGHYTVDGLRQDTVFPWGLWRDIVRHDGPRPILVYPHFHPLASLDIPVGRRYQPGGIALTSYLGDSTEFIATRDFRMGDSVRHIHWRSWARTGEPVVKEFQEEYFCRIALVLDTFLPPYPDETMLETFEAAVSLAAAVADRLAREEYVVDLFAAGPEIYHFQAGRNLAFLENVMDILACVEPCEEPAFEKIEPVVVDHLAQVSTTIFVLLDWDERRRQIVDVAREHGSETRVVLVRPGPPQLEPEASVARVSPDAVRAGIESL